MPGKLIPVEFEYLFYDHATVEIVFMWWDGDSDLGNQLSSYLTTLN